MKRKNKVTISTDIAKTTIEITTCGDGSCYRSNDITSQHSKQLNEIVRSVVGGHLIEQVEIIQK